jgi:ABC-2 type transport system permease protein
MKQTLSMTRKELSSFFGSPMALLFVFVFLAVTLFVFFRVDDFFARGIADARPLFLWMPVLTIFLVAALTMRQWSEEQRSGTMEVLLTMPVSGWQLVLGKFLAVMALVVLSLALTIFVPITVAFMGPLDWGPVFGGYLAAILMAAAYAAIGLFISSRTDNQIVALILTILVGGLFYLIGTDSLTAHVPGAVATILRSLGSGSRFESIERGVIDLRDLVYYVSLAGIFLVLNTLSLDRKRWSFGPSTRDYRRNANILSALLSINLILVNVWIYPLTGLRLDLTAQRLYSLSPATTNLLESLQEPLLIRGYFSQNTHPLLAPLIPTVEDMLREYEIAGHGKVTVDYLDPATDPAKEQEANQTYGIQPTPLQVSGQRQASIINVYFDILFRYGDQSTTLNFRDLISVSQNPDGSVDVELTNLEYNLTRAIKKVTEGFQNVDVVLASMPKPVKLTLYATPNTLPTQLKDAPATIQKVAQGIQAKSNGKFSYAMVDPDAPNATMNRQALLDQYHLQPIAAGLFSPDSYYLDMVLDTGNGAQIVDPGGDITEANVQTAIESALKRSTTGFLKVVGLWTPPANPQPDMFGQMQQPLSTWNQINQQLAQDYTVKTVDLTTGQVPTDVDVLVVVGPQDMTDKELYAIDQYLMRGGSVVLAAGNFVLGQPDMSGSLQLKAVSNGVAGMLASYGITETQALVMDPQNQPFPVPVTRQVGSYSVREIQALNYPFFVDVRPNNMDSNSPIVSQLPELTLNWASPLTIDSAKNQGRKVDVLLKSTADSWLRTSTDIQPNLQEYPEQGFPVEGERASRPLAVAIQGSFDSYFQGKPSPLTQSSPAQTDQSQGAQPTPTPAPLTSGTIQSSPATARLVVIGSTEFLDDAVFQIAQSMPQNTSLDSLQFLQNTVDWSAEDTDLLTIRSRGDYTRVLAPLTPQQETSYEVLNYILAVLALGAIGIYWTVRRRREKPLPLVPPGHQADKGTVAQQA